MPVTFAVIVVIPACAPKLSISVNNSVVAATVPKSIVTASPEAAPVRAKPAPAVSRSKLLPPVSVIAIVTAPSASANILFSCLISAIFAIAAVSLNWTASPLVCDNAVEKFVESEATVPLSVVNSSKEL